MITIVSSLSQPQLHLSSSTLLRVELVPNVVTKMNQANVMRTFYSFLTSALPRWLPLSLLNWPPPNRVQLYIIEELKRFLSRRDDSAKTPETHWSISLIKSYLFTRIRLVAASKTTSFELGLPIERQVQTHGIMMLLHPQTSIWWLSAGVARIHKIVISTMFKATQKKTQATKLVFGGDPFYRPCPFDLS